MYVPRRCTVALFGINLRSARGGSGDFFPKLQVLRSPELQNFYPSFSTPEKLQLKVVLPWTGLNGKGFHEITKVEKHWSLVQLILPCFHQDLPGLGHGHHLRLFFRSIAMVLRNRSTERCGIAGADLWYQSCGTSLSGGPAPCTRAVQSHHVKAPHMIRWIRTGV